MPTVAGTPSDFTSTFQAVTFEPRGSTSKCFYIGITEDTTVEEIEEFTVNMARTGDLDPRVQLGLTSATVYITDSDRMNILTSVRLIHQYLCVIAGTTVRLEPQRANNTEGRSVTICAVVSTEPVCHVEFDFNITLSTRGSTAGIYTFSTDVSFS